MARCHEEVIERVEAPSLQQARESLAQSLEILESLGLEEAATELRAILETLAGPGRPGVGHNVFRHQGEYWLVLYETDVFRLRESRGLTYLAALLAQPGREIHVLDLVGSDVALESDTGPLLDPEARRGYRQRLHELEADLGEVESANDPERAARHWHEHEFLRAELGRAEGLGGRVRRGGSTSERARQAVTKALKNALARITAKSPALGRHLASTVRTGTYCRYDPDPRIPITWKL